MSLPSGGARPLPLNQVTKPVRREIILPYPGGTPKTQPGEQTPNTRITGKYIGTRPAMQAQFNSAAEDSREDGPSRRTANQMHRINERTREGRLDTELK